MDGEESTVTSGADRREPVGRQVFEFDPFAGPFGDRRTDRGLDDRARFRLLVATQTAWMLIAFLTMVSLDQYWLEGYFLVSFVGLLFGSLLFAPDDADAAWWRRLRWVVRLGFLLLAVYVIQRIQEVMPVS